MDVRQKNVACFANDAHIILHIQRQLKIVAPIPAIEAVVGQNGVLKEDFEAAKVFENAVQHDDVGRDDEKIARQLRIGLIQLVKEAPSQRKRQHLRFARACRHFDDEPPPTFVEHAARYGPRAVKPH